MAAERKSRTGSHWIAHAKDRFFRCIVGGMAQTVRVWHHRTARAPDQSVGRSCFGVFFCEFLGRLKKFLPILLKLFGKVGSQRMLRLRVVD